MEKRVIAIGLDGTSFDLLNNLMESGEMPNFSSLTSIGSLRKMSSTLPPISSVAWSSLVTGKNPGAHNIYGFESCSTQMRSETLWEVLSKAGKKSVIVNIPGTYPPKGGAEILISGFLAPDLRSAVYPLSLYETLKKIGYRIDINPLEGRRSREKFLLDLNFTFNRRVEVMWHLFENVEWDFFLINFMETDRLQHFLLDVREYEKEFIKFYRRIDSIIGRVCERLDEGAFLIILSDHGLCPVKKNVYLNHWLKKEGYSPHVKCLFPGRIYAEREEVLDELMSRLYELQDPSTGEKIIKRLYRKEEIYEGDALPNAPDLLAVPFDGFNLKEELGEDLVGEAELAGMHTTSDAFFYIKGVDVVKERLQIVDCFPIILSLLDVTIPHHIDGDVLIKCEV